MSDELKQALREIMRDELKPIIERMDRHEEMTLQLIRMVGENNRLINNVCEKN